MFLNYINRLFFLVMMLMASSQMSAQPQCKDTAEHKRLQMAMWASCFQNDSKVVFDACEAYLVHTKADGNMLEASTSWVCSIMYSLGKMDISSAYHTTQRMKNDIQESKFAEEGKYFISNMMGHVYNTCGNIPGAQAEFLESAEQIKGTQFERDGLPFIYLALAHVHLNNNLEQTLHWLEITEQALEKSGGSWNYYRCMADVYAIKAIVRFKQRDFDAFQQCIVKMEEAESKNQFPVGDLFTPYARIYKTLRDKGPEVGLAEASVLPNLKEQYLLKCDIYRYLGDNEKAFMTQRELMHKRDSITGVMIAENIDRQEEEMQLLRVSQKTTKKMNYILFGCVVLAFIAIVLLHINLLTRRKYNKQLKAKNDELKSAYKQVAAADEMKTEFIRNVSHEIRTPLNIINGFTQVLTDENYTFALNERHSIADTISKNTRQITSLVNKMLALANESTKDLMKDVEQTDAIDVCQRAISAMPAVDAELIKVSFEDLTGGHATLMTNGDSLLQMLGNILENAVKFTEKGFIRLVLEKDKENMIFTVEDTGCGIPVDKVGTIFNRWVKVNEFKEGLGLGLAYCYETAQKLGGSLKLDKTSKEGTSFKLYLPIKLKTQ
jgi:signal transduction histidine kinase